MSEEINVEENKEGKSTFVEEARKETVGENLEAFLKDFNWDEHQQGAGVSDDDYDPKAFEKLVAENFVQMHDEDVTEGQILRITDRDAIIDIGSKSEGIISLNEFRYNQDLKVGDKVDVLIDRIEDATGQLVLSHKKARMIRAWECINKAYEKGDIINGYVKCKTKGGMIVEVLGIEAFLPGSQIDMKPIRDYDQYVGNTMEFKVVKINQEFKNIVVSHKALIEADIAEQKREIIAQLEKGQVIEGVVKNLTNYGVFVDLGGVDGLVHITDISWNRIASPSEVLELDQKVKVVILDFDEEKTRIQLGMKQLEQHPWDLLDENIKEGIIPARYNSTRLLGKPLLDILGKPMIQHVYERAIQSLDRLVVATDDKRVFDVAKGFGAEVVMTSPSHINGTSRCYEALQRCQDKSTEIFDIVINIQGDEPMLVPFQIEELKASVKGVQDFHIGTLVKKITKKEGLFDPSECYVVFNHRYEALYFSRATIPFLINIPREEWFFKQVFYKHVGLYAYSGQSLKDIVSLPPSRLEMAESLEQNRWIENGMKINVGITEYESFSVDTKEDLKRVILEMEKQHKKSKK
ncbi:30S ribosomal protein S1 [Elysia marginata]|uniref:30S ribosomal protein S1 n=1 Tax=Elysia marginata TaxID=1093978 RepID=A0AAV4I3Q2_9GAST|nr:30S ribosomal protein S1 [Elysia marginata]